MKTKKSKYLQYSPGDIVAVPMQRGGWGIALIARKPISQKCGDAGIWCIGFDRVYDTPPQPDCYEGLTILDAAVFHVCGDLNIAERIWPIIGSIPSYDPQQWPLPPHNLCVLARCPPSYSTGQTAHHRDGGRRTQLH